MALRTYQNFDLLLEAADGGGFRARVTTSPLGQSSSATFTLPFARTELERLLRRLDSRDSGALHQASMDLGGPLFESVFCEDIMLAWQRSQDFAREHGDGLRLRLRLTDAPAIAGLPWELLYDRRGNNFIAQSERTPVVRYLEVPQPPRPLAVDGALRILVVISSPTDLPELDVEAEWRRVQDALAGKVEQGTVKIDRLPAPTIQALSAWLRQHDVHILHFIGHGDYDERIQDGVVYFQDRYGRSTKVSPTVLGPYLRDHDPLRLVLLNACQSARVDSTDPFSGMAQGLVQQDCTAVVAMQFPISDGAATTFTGEFYGALADGFPVDQAATSARKALIAEYAAEWATPVLFLRAPDGRVFDHIVAPAANGRSDQGVFRGHGFGTRPGQEPPVRTGAPALPSRRAEADVAPAVDENVQFTVYRPRAIRPGLWYPMLAFAHLAERRPNAQPEEADPIEQVKALAQQQLGKSTSEYVSRLSDAGQAIPRQSELTFAPIVEGVEFNPARRTFQWLEDVHQEDFRLRAASSPTAVTARGRLTVFLGVVILADVELVIRIDDLAPQPSTPAGPAIPTAKMQNATPSGELEPTSATPYRKIFPSFSNRDRQIVEQVERFGSAIGDVYLQDLVALRSGEQRGARLRELIDEADVFQLFWSTNSMRSEHVRQEWEHALSLRRPNFVRPTYWEEPMPTSDDPLLPPEPLRQLHFYALSTTLDIAAGTAPEDDPSRPAEKDYDGYGSASAGQPGIGVSASLVCPHCGGANQWDSSFCSHCGSYLPSQGQKTREPPPPAAAMRPPDQLAVAYPPPMASQPRAGPPRYESHPKGSSSPAWIALLIGLILVGAILAFLIWKSQTATDPAEMGWTPQAVATNRAPLPSPAGSWGS
jgi:hypothetical protein